MLIKCLSCERWLDDMDIVFGFCPYCLEERARNLVEKFRPIDTTKEVFPKCAECNQEIIAHGMKNWDSLAKSFKLVCIDCGYKQVTKDRQYRDTPWGWRKHLK